MIRDKHFFMLKILGIATEAKRKKELLYHFFSILLCANVANELTIKAIPGTF